MSDIPPVVLLDLFPRAGFCWRRGQGSPRILRASARDGLVQRAIGDLCGDDGGRVRKRDAQWLVVDAVDAATDMIKHAVHGIRPDEGIIDFLERAAQFSDLGKAIPDDVWVELVYQIATAREKYERVTPRAQKTGDRNRLTNLAFAVDELLDAAGNHWDWLALKFFAYPHLMGEEVDYEISDSDSDGDSNDSNDVGADMMMMAEDKDEDKGKDENKEKEMVPANEAPAEQLPQQQMEELTIADVDGDVQMEM